MAARRCESRWPIVGDQRLAARDHLPEQRAEAGELHAVRRVYLIEPPCILIPGDIRDGMSQQVWGAVLTLFDFADKAILTARGRQNLSQKRVESYGCISVTNEPRLDFADAMEHAVIELEFLAHGDALRDIAQNAHELMVLTAPDLADGQLDRYRRSVLPPCRHFATRADDLRNSRGFECADIPVVLGMVGLGHQHRDVAADQLGWPVSEQRFRCRIDGGDHAVAVDRDDRVDHAPQNCVNCLCCAIHLQPL